MEMDRIQKNKINIWFLFQKFFFPFSLFLSLSSSVTTCLELFSFQTNQTRRDKKKKEEKKNDREKGKENICSIFFLFLSFRREFNRSSFMIASLPSFFIFLPLFSLSVLSFTFDSSSSFDQKNGWMENKSDAIFILPFWGMKKVGSEKVREREEREGKKEK